jgi:hypothetical protein
MRNKAKAFRSNWVENFVKSCFSVDPKFFEKKALELFRYQAENCSIYRQYLSILNTEVEAIDTLEKIPFLPISFFKSHEVKSTEFVAEKVFESSGTTGSSSSKHLLADLKVYEESFFKTFENFYGKAEDFCILALLPSYLERNNSSLVYMSQKLIERSKCTESGFFLDNFRELQQILNKLAARKQKTLLIGVSFGLLDFCENYAVPDFPELTVMETGGMKGRRKEMIREELHQKLSLGFHKKNIHSEYGMTELLSQAYSKGNGLFESPSWMKILVRKQDDPFSYARQGETGAINVIDLANIYSCAFIQTDDLGKLHPEGSFEVLGRFDSAEVRGCNLMVQD